MSGETAAAEVATAKEAAAKVTAEQVRETIRIPLRSIAEAITFLPADLRREAIAEVGDWLGHVREEHLSRTMAERAAAAIPANSGHGHVRPRPDGVKARCGGPPICPVCAREAAAAR
ncbi:MAG: hypothetical protein ACRDXE_10550 [Acidimicrobiales bacterium]